MVIDRYSRLVPRIYELPYHHTVMPIFDKRLPRALSSSPHCATTDPIIGGGGRWRASTVLVSGLPYQQADN